MQKVENIHFSIIFLIFFIIFQAHACPSNAADIHQSLKGFFAKENKKLLGNFIFQTNKHIYGTSIWSLVARKFSYSEYLTEQKS